MKTTYEKWIEVNNKLKKCFDGVPADKFNKLSAHEADAVCSTEKAAVLSFIQNGSLTFPALLKERMAAVGLSTQHH